MLVTTSNLQKIGLTQKLIFIQRNKNVNFIMWIHFFGEKGSEFEYKWMTGLETSWINRRGCCLAIGSGKLYEKKAHNKLRVITKHNMKHAVNTVNIKIV